MSTARDHCIRCGECCLGASPALHREDLPLIRKGKIPKTHLFTLRRGEAVKDNVNERFTIIQDEMIKISEREGEQAGCIYYNHREKACMIYEKRPAQCAALKCWDTRAFMRVFSGPKAQRSDLIDNEVLLRLMGEHEERCSYSVIEGLVKDIETKGEEAVERILEILRFDHHLRPFVAEKLGLEVGEMDFLFGRPLNQTIHMFGLKVIQEPDGSFLLTKR